MRPGTIAILALLAGMAGGQIEPVTAKLSDLSGSVLTLARTAAASFEVRLREAIADYPVVLIRPSVAGKNMAVDVTPRGVPQELATGYAWIHVCDKDVEPSFKTTRGTNCVQISAKSTAMYLGARAVGGDTPKRLDLGVNNDTYMTIGTTGKVGINNTTPTIDLDVSGFMRSNWATEPTCNTNWQGAIFFDTATKHFKGCNATAWQQLD